MFMQTPADPTALEQVSIMIKKYNQLVNDIKELESIHLKRNLEIEKLKEQMNSELSELRLKSNELKMRVEVVTKFRTNVAREFNQIIKKDALNRLSRRIDLADYENRISRNELNNLVDRRLRD